MTVATDYLSNALARIVEMEKRAVSDTKAAAPYPFFEYPNFPYWLNYPGTITPDIPGTDLYEETYLIKMRLVIGHNTEGYEGSLAARLWGWMPQTLVYFRERPFLQYEDDENAAASRKLDPVKPPGCRIRVSRGFAVFLDHPKQHVGTEFDLIVPFNLNLRPVY